MIPTSFEGCVKGLFFEYNFTFDLYSEHASQRLHFPLTMPIKSRLESTLRYLSFFFELSEEDIFKTRALFFPFRRIEAFSTFSFAFQQASVFHIYSQHTTFKMAPHENVFFVEKFSNDSLHNPQREGTDHTSKEIQIAARLLGRDSVVVDERTRKKVQREKVKEKRKAEILENSKPLGDGFVLVGSGDSMRRINLSEVISQEKRTGEENADGFGQRRRKFDSNSRWKTEERIENGGTAGQSELVAARNAASELEKKKKDRSRRDEEEELPLVVLPSELVFGSDGFVKKSTEDEGNDVNKDEAMKMIAIERRKAKENSKRDVQSTAKKTKNIRKLLGL